MIALIFDMDGVLIDSNETHRACWIEFNRRHGLETTAEMLQRMYGKRNDEIVRDFYGNGLTDAEVAALGHAKEAFFRETVGDRLENLLVPGVREFLNRYINLHKALGSNAEPENIAFLLDGAKLRPHFRAVVDGSQVANAKPHPDIYLRAAELLGVAPRDCIVFEDSPSGVAAGVAAGMRVIGISTTYVNLPGTVFSSDNFLSGELNSWLQAQMRSV
jgi:beta-phosphoglucomutase family hydrolase